MHNMLSCELLDPEAFARMRQCSAKSLTKAVAEGRIFCVERDGLTLYPAFFVNRPSRREALWLELVSKRLGNLSGGSKLQFFATSKGSLGGLDPLQALAAGRLAAVKVAADGFVER